MRGRVIISDTHGLLRPEALKALQGAEHILHAGDVGDADDPGCSSRDSTCHGHSGQYR